MGWAGGWITRRIVTPRKGEGTRSGTGGFLEQQSRDIDYGGVLVAGFHYPARHIEGQCM